MRRCRRRRNTPGPLLRERLGAEVWVKHENHTPLGAFKVRGGLVYLHGLAQREPDVSRRHQRHARQPRPVDRASPRAGYGLPPPSSCRTATAWRRTPRCARWAPSWSSTAVTSRQAREHAAKIAGELGLHFVPSFHRDLVRGVASYWVEFFRAVQPAVVFVPIGQGSGICACIARARTPARHAHHRRGFGACHAPISNRFARPPCRGAR